MSAAAIPGRTIPNLLADSYGQFNALSIVSISTGVLIFALLGVDSTPGVIVFAILYGFFSGACQCSRSIFAHATNHTLVSSLCPPTLASLAKDVSEIGQVFYVLFNCT